MIILTTSIGDCSCYIRECPLRVFSKSQNFEVICSRWFKTFNEIGGCTAGYWPTLLVIGLSLSTEIEHESYNYSLITDHTHTQLQLIDHEHSLSSLKGR